MSEQKTRVRFKQKRFVHPQDYARIHSAWFVFCVQLKFSREGKKMGLISDVVAIGTMIFLAGFAAWMVKQLMADK
jgi:hypothetical protein